LPIQSGFILYIVKSVMCYWTVNIVIGE